MMIKVTGEAVLPLEANGENTSTILWEEYTDRDTLRRAQFKMLERDSDFWEDAAVRYSGDNGRTWGPWEKTQNRDYSEAPDGSWEMIYMNYRANLWNPVHRHYIGVGRHLIWPGGHLKSYEEYWKHGGISTSDHAYMLVRREDSDQVDARLIRFEPGPEFDPKNPLNEGYLLQNWAYYYMTPVIAQNGDVILGLSPLMSDCLKLRGLDPAGIFPTRPGGNSGLIVARGVWNGERYDFTFSRPVVISDLLSSRGIDEPTVALLESGRIVVVFRGSNNRFDWTRIEPGAPGFKWYCYSDDGGLTFTDPAPWHFDTGEVIYSSATISHFIRSEKNGRLYWVGNITDHHVDGNYPRWPLQIVEVDETYGTAKKDSVTVIDTRREGETEQVQLSNFFMLQDRETGNIDLWLAKYGQFSKTCWQKSETWKYTIHLEE